MYVHSKEMKKKSQPRNKNYKKKQMENPELRNKMKNPLTELFGK